MHQITVVPAHFSTSSRASHSSGRHDYRGSLRKLLKPSVFGRLESHWIHNLGVMEK